MYVYDWGVPGQKIQYRDGEFLLFEREQKKYLHPGLLRMRDQKKMKKMKKMKKPKKMCER
jgi:hypothetical protein